VYPELKGTTGLYKPVGGTVASFCTNLAYYTSGTLFSKFKKKSK